MSDAAPFTIPSEPSPGEPELTDGVALFPEDATDNTPDLKTIRQIRDLIARSLQQNVPTWNTGVPIQRGRLIYYQHNVYYALSDDDGRQGAPNSNAHFELVVNLGISIQYGSGISDDDGHWSDSPSPHYSAALDNYLRFRIGNGAWTIIQLNDPRSVPMYYWVENQYSHYNRFYIYAGRLYFCNRFDNGQNGAPDANSNFTLASGSGGMATVFAGDYADNTAYAQYKAVLYQNKLYFYLSAIPADNTTKPDVDSRAELIPFGDDVTTTTPFTGETALGTYRRSNNRQSILSPAGAGGFYVIQNELYLNYQNRAGDDNETAIRAIPNGHGLDIGGKVFTVTTSLFGTGGARFWGRWENHEPDTTAVGSDITVSIVNQETRMERFIGDIAQPFAAVRYLGRFEKQDTPQHFTNTTGAYRVTDSEFQIKTNDYHGISQVLNFDIVEVGHALAVDGRYFFIITAIDTSVAGQITYTGRWRRQRGSTSPDLDTTATGAHIDIHLVRHETDMDLFVTPQTSSEGGATGSVPNASTSQRGVIEIATEAESDTATDTERAMTPALSKRNRALYPRPIGTWNKDTGTAGHAASGDFRATASTLEISKTDSGGTGKATALGKVSNGHAIAVGTKIFIVESSVDHSNRKVFTGYWADDSAETNSNDASVNIGHIAHRTRFGGLVKATDIVGRLENSQLPTDVVRGMGFQARITKNGDFGVATKDDFEGDYLLHLGTLSDAIENNTNRITINFGGIVVHENVVFDPGEDAFVPFTIDSSEATALANNLANDADNVRVSISFNQGNTNIDEIYIRFGIGTAYVEERGGTEASDASLDIDDPSTESTTVPPSRRAAADAAKRAAERDEPTDAVFADFEVSHGSSHTIAAQGATPTAISFESTLLDSLNATGVIDRHSATEIRLAPGTYQISIHLCVDASNRSAESNSRSTYHFQAFDGTNVVKEREHVGYIRSSGDLAVESVDTGFIIRAAVQTDLQIRVGLSDKGNTLTDVDIADDSVVSIQLLGSGVEVVPTAYASRSERVGFDAIDDIGTTDETATIKTATPITVTHGSGDPNMLAVGGTNQVLRIRKEGSYLVQFTGTVDLIPGSDGSLRALPRVRLFNGVDQVSEIDDHYHLTNTANANDLNVSGYGTVDIPEDNYDLSVRIANDVVGGQDFDIEADWALTFKPIGVKGADGRTPRFSLHADGERQVLQLDGYLDADGTFTAEAEATYVSATGYTTTLSAATNLRGDGLGGGTTPFDATSIGNWRKDAGSGSTIASGDFWSDDSTLKISRTDEDGNSKTSELNQILVGHGIKIGTRYFVVETTTGYVDYDEYDGYWVNGQEDNTGNNIVVSIGHVPHLTDIGGFVQLSDAVGQLTDAQIPAGIARDSEISTAIQTALAGISASTRFTRIPVPTTATYMSFHIAGGFTTPLTGLPRLVGTNYQYLYTAAHFRIFSILTGTSDFTIRLEELLAIHGASQAGAGLTDMRGDVDGTIFAVTNRGTTNDITFAIGGIGRLLSPGHGTPTIKPGATALCTFNSYLDTDGTTILYELVVAPFVEASSGSDFDVLFVAGTGAPSGSAGEIGNWATNEVGKRYEKTASTTWTERLDLATQTELDAVSNRVTALEYRKYIWNDSASSITVGTSQVTQTLDFDPFQLIEVNSYFDNNGIHDRAFLKLSVDLAAVASDTTGDLRIRVRTTNNLATGHTLADEKVTWATNVVLGRSFSFGVSNPHLLPLFPDSNQNLYLFFDADRDAGSADVVVQSVALTVENDRTPMDGKEIGEALAEAEWRNPYSNKFVELWSGTHALDNDNDSTSDVTMSEPYHNFTYLGFRTSVGTRFFSLDHLPNPISTTHTYYLGAFNYYLGGAGRISNISIRIPTSSMLNKIRLLSLGSESLNITKIYGIR